MTCDICPVAGRTTSRPCFGEAHPPACDLLRKGQPGRREQLIAWANTPPPAKADLSLAKLVVACPHKAPAHCSCNAFAHCRLGKGDAGRVQYRDCLECRRADRDAPA